MTKRFKLSRARVKAQFKTPSIKFLNSENTFTFALALGFKSSGIGHK